MKLKEIETPDLHKLLGYLDAVADFIRGGELKWYFDARLFDCEGTFADVRSLIKTAYPDSKPDLADIDEGSISDFVATLKHEFSKWLKPPEVPTLLKPVTDMRTELWQHLKACVDYENARVFEYYTREPIDGFGSGGITGNFAAVILNETQKRCLMLSGGDSDQSTANKSLDASGGSVFLNQNDPAEGALIRAAASTQPLYGFSLKPMREEVLKEFFAGNIDARMLAKDLRGAMVTSGGITKHPIEDMTEAFDLHPEHLTRLCDSVLAGDLKPEHLQAIGFCIVASDQFEYDTDTREGELVGDTAMEWSAPMVHYPLTLANVAKFRQRLITGKDPFTVADAI